MEQKVGPEKTGEQAGPCEGMDCMHGVLMHGDEQQGKKHTKDDEQKQVTVRNLNPIKFTNLV